MAGLIILLYAASARADMIDGVKGAILSIDRSMTIGQAFDGWANCASTEWKHVQTDRGQNIVISICHMRDAQEFLSRVASSPAVSKTDNTGAIHLHGLRKAMVVLQWNINLDETFQLAYAEGQYAWSDGKYIQVPLDSDDTISQIYNDNVTFDLSGLEASDDLSALKTAQAYDRIFYAMYLDATQSR